MWIGVGNWGFRSSTSDGQTWHTEQNPSTGDDHSPDLLRGVAYGDGVFLAVGGDQNSMVMRTTDGVNWEEDLAPFGGQWLGGAAYGNGRWIAAGGVGFAIYSDDGGLNWSELEGLPFSHIRTMAFADGTFIGTGDDGLIITSSDGESFTERRQDGAVRLDYLDWAGGTWVAAGRQWNGNGFDSSCFASADAQSWVTCPIEGGSVVHGVYRDGGDVIVVGDGGYWRVGGVDDFSWASAEVPEIAYGADGQWVGVRYETLMAGDALESMSEAGQAERGFRDFTIGYVQP